MRRALCTFVLAGFVSGRLAAGGSEPADGSGLGQILNFEATQTGLAPVGWGGGPTGTLFVDGAVVHSGKWAGRIERKPDSPQDFSSIMKSVPIDFQGKVIELRGFLRTEEVSGFVGLWMREDGESPSLAFENMQQRQIKGTTEWMEYSITLPVHPDARKLFFGFLVVGTGKAWADDLQLLVDGKPIWQAPKAEHVPTVLETDHEFDAGSKIVLAQATPTQIGNLAMLCQVWGFLKYHHPKVMAGQVHWDYELFRIMPAILAANDLAGASAVLLQWIDGLGEAKPAGSPAEFNESDLHLRPDLRWLQDEARLGSALSQRLRTIQSSRSRVPRQFYVSQASGVGNPVFDHEPAYQRIPDADAGYQLLGLFRFWNIIRYWFPYRDLIKDDWDATLAEFIPRIGLAKTNSAYQLEMMAMIARVHDTHANLWSSLQVRPPTGDSQLPVTVRFIEGRAVIAKLLSVPGQSPSGLQVGDVITAIDGVAVGKLVEQWSPYYAASNETTRLRDIAHALTRGPAGAMKVWVRRGDQEQEITANRVAISALGSQNLRSHDLPGPVFRRLSKDVAYLKLSAVKAADADQYIEEAAGTKGLVIDVRNYPSEFVVFALGSHLVDQPTEFARFTICDLTTPGAFHWRGKPLSLSPRAPHYSGRIVILIDEMTLSQAEYTTMAFRVAPGAIVVGSTTAGADGNVMPIPLPGGLSTMMSGIGVFYPDKRPTQQVGIIPDIEARPTIEGIKAGRDEVLEEALRQILGPETPVDEIRRLSTVHE
jgi:hypothetical protein